MLKTFEVTFETNGRLFIAVHLKLRNTQQARLPWICTSHSGTSGFCTATDVVARRFDWSTLGVSAVVNLSRIFSFDASSSRVLLK
jgi:hypothetical protein